MKVEAPERIWAASVTDSYGEWQTVKDGLPRPVEYVRADKLEELAATLAEAKRENEAMRRALTLIDALDPEEHVYGCSADALRGLVSQMGRLARNAGGKDAE